VRQNEEKSGTLEHRSAGAPVKNELQRRIAVTRWTGPTLNPKQFQSASRIVAEVKSTPIVYP